jgi:hypothetical protein
MRPILPLLLVVTAAAGCDDPPPPPPPTPSRTESAPPEPPSLESLAPPAAGRSKRAEPEWNERRNRYEHRVIDGDGRFGRGERVTLIRSGSEDDGVKLTYYGSTLGPGTFPIRAATDESVTSVRGEDARVFLLAMKHHGHELRSIDGTVRIEQVSDTAIVGSWDARVVRLRLNPTETVSRGRFHATPDGFLDALIEHQAGVEERLRERRR